jgi:hypothetical protein
MKKLLVSIIVIIVFNGCLSQNNNQIIGTWTNICYFNGINEIIFTKDKMTIKQYKYGGNPDFEIIREYKIIDNIIFIKNHNWTDSSIDSPFFNYFINGNNLYLYGYYSNVFTRKNNRNIAKIQNNLNGKWILNSNDKIIEFIFIDENIYIYEYSNGEVIRNYTMAFELEYYYLNIANTNSILLDIGIYSNNILYYINNDTLILFQIGVGEVDQKIIFLNKH